MKKNKTKRFVSLLCLFAIFFYMVSCTMPTQAEGNALTVGETAQETRASYPAWDVNAVYNNGSRVIHSTKIWEAKWWNQGKEPGGVTDVSLVWTDLGPATGPIEKPEIIFELKTPGQIHATMIKDKDDATSFSGRLILENPNSSYVWNESYFAIYDIEFQTTSQFSELKSSNGSVEVTQANGKVTIDLGWQSLIEYGQKVELLYTATKAGAQVFPTNFKVNYVRGDEVRMYPEYATLPASFVKGSASYTASNLVANSANYYQTAAQPNSAGFIVYNPDHDTQVRIGQTTMTNYKVNTVDNVKIWIPSKFMAMGIATVYEYFKINPNYMAALGTKENFSAGVVPPEAGVQMNPRMIDGKQYYWPIVMGHVDGPFQQEVGNFNDARIYYVDYLGELAKHTDFTQIMSQHDPKWIAASLSSGMSISVTRETLAGVRAANYYNFLDNAADPWAEFAIVTYAYNRGVSMFFSKKLFTDNRAEALSVTNIPEHAPFDMGGFGGHVPTVKAITKKMNDDTSNIYDEQITWADMEAYFAELKKFYAKGVPSDAQWTAMLADVQKAHTTLAANWGGTHVSFRYDFLTLLRVAKAHLPETNPRPTGNQWYYIIKNAKP